MDLSKLGLCKFRTLTPKGIGVWDWQVFLLAWAELISAVNPCYCSKMAGGYEKSEDYGGPEPRWPSIALAIGIVVLIAFLNAG